MRGSDPRAARPRLPPIAMLVDLAGAPDLGVIAGLTLRSG